MPSQKLYFSIPPLNDINTGTNAGAITGGFSTKNGNANIKFALGAQDRLLDTSDMYLSGQIIMVNADGTPLTITAGSMAKADFSAKNGTTLQKTSNQNISNFAGVETMIKRIFLQSKKTSVNISEHRDYPKYVETRNAWTNNNADYRISPMIRTSAGGVDAGNTNRHSVLMDNIGNVSNITNIGDPNYGSFFSFKLDTALLNNSQPLHLGSSQLGGLLINLELANENGFFYERFKQLGTNQTSATGLSSSYYVVKNLRLDGRLLVPTPQDLASYNSNFVLSDRFSLLNDVNSSVNSAKYSPNVSAVHSMVNLFLDQTQKNNRNANQGSFRLPLGLKDYQQNKNNVRQPQDFVVEVVPNLLTKTTYGGGGSIDASTIGNKASMEGDAEVRNFFQRAVLNGDLADKTVCSLSLTNRQLEADYETRGAISQDNGVGKLFEANAMGVGLDYTHHMGLVSNYSGSADYDLLLKSGVASGDAVLPTDRRDLAELMNTYVKNISSFNSANLVKQM